MEPVHVRRRAVLGVLDDRRQDVDAVDLNPIKAAPQALGEIDHVTNPWALAGPGLRVFQVQVGEHAAVANAEIDIDAIERARSHRYVDIDCLLLLPRAQQDERANAAGGLRIGRGPLRDRELRLFSAPALSLRPLHDALVTFGKGVAVGVGDALHRRQQRIVLQVCQVPLFHLDQGHVVVPDRAGVLDRRVAIEIDTPLVVDQRSTGVRLRNAQDLDQLLPVPRALAQPRVAQPDELALLIAPRGVAQVDVSVVRHTGLEPRTQHVCLCGLEAPDGLTGALPGRVVVRHLQTATVAASLRDYLLGAVVERRIGVVGAQEPVVGPVLEARVRDQVLGLSVGGGRPMQACGPGPRR